MLIEAIDARYVHSKNVQVTLGIYSNGQLALIGESEDEEGYPDSETYSVNLVAYDMIPPNGHVYIKDDSEHKGLAHALQNVGVGTVIEPIYYGPFRTPGVLFKLADTLINEGRKG